MAGVGFWCCCLALWCGCFICVFCGCCLEVVLLLVSVVFDWCFGSWLLVVFWCLVVAGLGILVSGFRCSLSVGFIVGWFVGYFVFAFCLGCCLGVLLC